MIALQSLLERIRALEPAEPPLVDRVLRGYVIDFIDWHWFDPNWLRPGRHWPTFNVADAGISVGLVLLFLEMLFVKKPAPQEGGKADAGPAGRPSPGKRPA